MSALDGAVFGLFYGLGFIIIAAVVVFIGFVAITAFVLIRQKFSKQNNSTSTSSSSDYDFDPTPDKLPTPEESESTKRALEYCESVRRSIEYQPGGPEDPDSKSNWGGD